MVRGEKVGGGETWQNTKRSDDTEGHEDTTGPIVLLYMFDLAGFTVFRGVGWFLERRGVHPAREGRKGSF